MSGDSLSLPSVSCVQPTRLVLILKEDFHRIPGLLTHCYEALKVSLLPSHAEGYSGIGARVVGALLLPA